MALSPGRPYRPIVARVDHKISVSLHDRSALTPCSGCAGVPNRLGRVVGSGVKDKIAVRLHHQSKVLSGRADVIRAAALQYLVLRELLTDATRSCGRHKQCRCNQDKKIACNFHVSYPIIGPSPGRASGQTNPCLILEAPNKNPLHRGTCRFTIRFGNLQSVYKTSIARIAAAQGSTTELPNRNGVPHGSLLLNLCLQEPQGQ